ncbi:hypothetical protein B296_00013481 [Ensete ventricosum]|uniref:Small ribosomal subunit protein uS5 C-terminal domain-containing protein n=1 Tax=Ensete ventricosum TaxID=4639 RepID=A0A427AW24_ENSVE|nr:hypothetical protein B296_00013481 [Ensete ventricosum]
MLRPASPGTGVIAGGAVRIVLEMAGVENALGKQLGSKNALNNARATVAAVQGMRQFRDVASERHLFSQPHPSMSFALAHVVWFGRVSSASPHSESRSVKILAHRSKVLSRLSGDSVSVAVIPSSTASGDFRTADALAVMWSFFNVDLTVTTRRLVEVRKNYFIPPEYELHIPLSGECPYDAFLCGFSLSTDALEARLRFPLHPLIEACLEKWRISPS